MDLLSVSGVALGHPAPMFHMWRWACCI